MERSSLTERLKECGLTEKEATVFLELLVTGPGKASEVARRVGVSRMDAYNQLKRLSDRGLVRATVEKPMRFVPLSIEDALGQLVSEREEAIQRIEAQREFLKEHIKQVAGDGNMAADSTFRIHQERRTINSQIRKMVAEGHAEVHIAATKRSIGRYASAGVLGELRHLEPGVRVRVLTQVSEDNLEAVLEAIEGGGFELRHSDRVGSNLVIVDGVQILNSLVFDDAPGSKGKGDVALWTDSADFVRAQTSFFEEAWEESTPLVERVTELRTGRVVEPIKAYLGEGSMYEKFRGLVKAYRDVRPEVAAHLLKQGTTYSLREFGIEVAHIFQLIGHRIGQEIAHDLTATDAPALWREVAGLWEREGFGRFRKLPKQEKEALGVKKAGPLLVIHDNFSARGMPNVGRPLCAVDEGIFAGLVETRLGRGCRVKELKCIGTGHDHCLFHVRFPDEDVVREETAALTARASAMGR
ncbi:MAG: hypothetical protein KY455_12385 [Euryarchaeota archaeon]|nr:hypothetical protein [Euryarchaeota archaeon]